VETRHRHYRELQPTQRMHPKNQRVTSYDHCDSIMRPPRADFDLRQVFLQPGEVCRI
jgi:hypothetical protein